MAPGLAEVCAVDLVTAVFFECGASVGLKLKRAGLLKGYKDDEICTASSTRVLSSPSAAQRSASQQAELCLSEWQSPLMSFDCADEIVSRLLPLGACPSALLRVACERNHLASARLLLERGGELHQVEVRRGRRRSLVDMATRGASLDGDWRLTLLLLRAGAVAESAQGVLFAPLRRGDVGLARELIGLKVLPDARGLASLLCDVCAHGATASAALLIDELGVPVNAKNERDGDTGMDRALAWHCWETAEWLALHKGGAPAKLSSALNNLLDAEGDPTAASTLRALRRCGVVSFRDHLTAAVQRGDMRLCEELLSELGPPAAAGAAGAAAAPCLSAAGGPSSFLDLFSSYVGGPPLVDLALCHGHLRVAAALLRRGLRAQDPSQARSDARLYSGGRGAAGAAQEVLDLLPAAASEFIDVPAQLDEDLTPGSSRALLGDAAGVPVVADSFLGLLPLSSGEAAAATLVAPACQEACAAGFLAEVGEHGTARPMEGVEEQHEGGGSIGSLALVPLGSPRTSP